MAPFVTQVMWYQVLAKQRAVPPKTRDRAISPHFSGHFVTQVHQYQAVAFCHNFWSVLARWCQ